VERTSRSPPQGNSANSYGNKLEVLESRAFDAAMDTDILEYEIRQEIIHEMCNQLANANVTA
jgi:hypothetical protein